MFKILATALLPRILRFRKEVVLLWKAFWLPATPLHLKAIALLAVAYLVSPVDLVPDVIPVLGWLDDLIIVPLIVGWVVSRLPRDPQAEASGPVPGDRGGPIIEGSARRI